MTDRPVIPWLPPPQYVALCEACHAHGPLVGIVREWMSPGLTLRDQFLALCLRCAVKERERNVTRRTA